MVFPQHQKSFIVLLVKFKRSSWCSSQYCLKAVMERAQDAGVMFNKENSEFNSTEVKYLGDICQ